MAEAAAECLENVVRHAGTREASLALWGEGAAVRVTIRDRGQGFGPTRSEGRFGLRHSVQGRMKSVGGTATVASEPGRGTTIALEWSHG